MMDEFPDKPKGMRWCTYNRLRADYDAAEARSMVGLTRFLDRLHHLERKAIRRHRR